MRIKEIRVEKKKLNIDTKCYFKAYLTGLFFSLLIMVIPTLIIYNLSVFYSLAVLMHYLVALDAVFFIFFILYFKDKALEIYVPGYKEIEYRKLFWIFMTIVFVICMLTAFIIVRLFRWW